MYLSLVDLPPADAKLIRNDGYLVPAVVPRSQAGHHARMQQLPVPDFIREFLALNRRKKAAKEHEKRVTQVKNTNRSA